jgi:RNA recognition motif. (a.k.a. RRM, RBD, or RNP domain)
MYALLQQMGMGLNPMAAAGAGYGGWPAQTQGASQMPQGSRYASAGGMGGGSVNVKMRGLPFHATVGDIVAFFAGYDISRNPNAIALNIGPDGRPSGEAWVQFASPDEALRAVHEKNRAHMGSRYVELFLS